ncbi:hypothetical protein QFZ67_000877 [Streptomyces sp. V1I1]|nr:hypothetical protein [Streptomyces sp. V1I1]
MFAYELSGGDEFIDGGAQGGPGDAQFGAERALGGDGVTGPAVLDEGEQIRAHPFAFEYRLRRVAVVH